jgi:hypothetical protein
VHGHQLQRVLAFAGLVLARLQRGVGEEGGERIHLLPRLRVALIRDERRGGVHQLVQVLDALGTFALGLVVLQQPALRHDVLDPLGECQALGLLAQGLDQRHEGRDLAGRRQCRLVQVAAGGLGGVLQRFDRARADAARREVHHAQESIVVGGRSDEAQVGERVLDFRAFEKAQAPVHPVRQRRGE